jgi:hypothetical protein
MNSTNPNLHPLDLDSVNDLVNLFLADVIFEYRDHEIKDWLQGLTGDAIEAILAREGNASLRSNAFVIPFTYLKFQVVPPFSIVEKLRAYLQKHALIPETNEVLKKTKENFTRIFTGKTDFIYQSH